MLSQVCVNYRSILAVFVCIGVTVTYSTSSSDEADLNREELSLLNFPETKRAPHDDLTQILLKKMRFRDTEPVLQSLRHYHLMPKSKRQEMLMNNLAALLSGLKQRQAEPSLRLPSLRFG